MQDPPWAAELIVSRFIPNREPESSHGCYDLLPEVDLGSDKEDKEEQDERKKVFSGKSDSEARRGRSPYIL